MMNRTENSFSVSFFFFFLVNSFSMNPRSEHWFLLLADLSDFTVLFCACVYESKMVLGKSV